MFLLLRKAVRDLKTNVFLNAVSVFTVALSVLCVSAFTLFFVNADAVTRQWAADLCVMAYIKPGMSQEEMAKIGQKIRAIPGVQTAEFISGDQALERLRHQLQKQSSLLEGLPENPLPDAFEIRMAASPRNWEIIEPVARQTAAIEGVDEVEYGQEWLGRFMGVLNLARMAGYGIGGLFFMAAVFFMANTIRLVLYSRRQEIEIMNLVGASESFIKDPFYIQSMILGVIGGGLGLGALYAMFRWFSVNFETTVIGVPIRFLSPDMMLFLVLGSVFVGWTGCFISLRQFLKS
jgi:cell division transport system permease protein